MRGGAAAWLAGILLAAAAPVQARTFEIGPLDLHLAGDVKGFFFSSFPYELPFVPDDPVGQAVFDFRLKADARITDWLRFDAHHQLAATTISGIGLAGGGLASPATGARDLPQAVDLSWSAADGPGHTIEGRMDRLSLRVRQPRFHLTAGRQAITFGRAYFFTPLDLVAPFSPVVVDREYKPGIDAVRGDYFFGVGGQVTAVAAYAGGWDTAGLIFAGQAGTVLGGWDVALFGAAVQRDAVVGAKSAGAIGPVAVRAEGTLTFPSGDDTPFVRAVVGADHLLAAGRLHLFGELYVQTVGAADPADYLLFAMSERVQRAELWTLGRYYAAASARYELNPLLHASVFAVANLGDPSVLFGPGLSWSVADAARVEAGAYVAAGGRPEVEAFALVPRSEFGLFPTTAYVALMTYF
jgi:hypothetical protein